MPVQFKSPQEYKSPLYDIAVKVVKKQFPDLVQRINTTVEPDFTGIAGDYTRSKNTVRVDPYGKNYTADNVIELVNTILHELNHAETNSSEARKTEFGPFGDASKGREFSPGRLGDYDYARSSGLKSQEDSAIAKAKELKLPSSSEDSVSELLANLMAADQMKSRNIPAGATQQSVDEIMKLPGVADWVARNRFPQSPVLQTFEPSLTDKLIDFFK